MDDAALPETRQRIILAAYRLFGRQGYARTSVQDIAAAAQVKKPLLYYYFENKEALYKALFQQSSTVLAPLFQDARQRARQSGRPGIGPREAELCAVTDALLGVVRENEDPVRFFMTHTFAPDTDRPVCAHDPEGDYPMVQLTELATAAIAEGELQGEPQDLVLLIMGAMHLCMLRFLQHPDQQPLADGLGTHIVTTVVRGFRRR